MAETFSVVRYPHYEASSPIQESNLISLRLAERERAAVKPGIWRQSPAKAPRINMYEHGFISGQRTMCSTYQSAWKVPLKSLLIWMQTYSEDQCARGERECPLVVMQFTATVCLPHGLSAQNTDVVLSSGSKQGGCGTQGGLKKTNILWMKIHFKNKIFPIILAIFKTI